MGKNWSKGPKIEGKKYMGTATCNLFLIDKDYVYMYTHSWIQL